jgi:hypoxanthine phosphoribosyltransferase
MDLKHMPQAPLFLAPLYFREEIAKRVREIALDLSLTYTDREPIVVGVLKGAFVFIADLVRAMTIPVKVDFVQVASYGYSTESTGSVHLSKDLGFAITNQDVILVDTVVDTGLTLRFLFDLLSQRNPRSLTTCVLIDKRQRRQVAVQADYVGFTLADGFVVGYGLDHGEAYRHLDSVYLLSNAEG